MVFPYSRLSKKTALAQRLKARSVEDNWKREWVNVFNGGVHLCSHTGRCVIVHCCGPHCGCQNQEHTRARVKQCLLQINFRRRPPPAQLSEWTRVRDCARFHALNIFTAGVGQHIFAAAAAEIRGVPAPADWDMGDDSERLAAFLKETNFAALVGKRVAVVRSLVMHPGQNCPNMVVAVILEALEMVTEWYLIAESRRMVDDLHPH